MKVLILRPDNIGDVILFSGALQHIRLLYSDAHITLAVQKHIVNLVEFCPYIDSCVAISDLSKWETRSYAKRTLASKLRHPSRSLRRLLNILRKPLDLIIYPIKSPQVSHLEIIYDLNPKQVIGITGCNINAPGGSYPQNLWPSELCTSHLNVSNIDPWIHEFYTTSNFLNFLGCRTVKASDVVPEFWLSKSEKNYLEEVNKNSRKIIGLFPGTSYVEKNWPAENYGKLAKIMAKQHVYAIFGSSADKEITDQVALSIRTNSKDAEVLNLTGMTTLRELVRSIASCDLFIGMDTSGLHMAIAANVPAICIVSGAHYGRFVPWGDPARHIILTKKMDCFFCNWVCSKDEVECIRGVTSEQVAVAANELLVLNKEK